MNEAIVQQRQAQWPFHDHSSVELGGKNAPANPVGIFDKDLVSCGAILHSHLKVPPDCWNARIEKQEGALHPQPEYALDAGPLHPIVAADMVGYSYLMAADESGTIMRAEAMKPRGIPIISSRKVLELKPTQSAA